MRWAREVTPPLLEILERYFGSEYPYEKLDIVTIPQTVLYGLRDSRGFGFCQSDLAAVVWSILAKSCRCYESLETVDISRVVPRCGNTEHPFNGLGTPLREAGLKVLCDMIVDTGQEVAEEAFGVGVWHV